jgi:uroporphyrinogen decarboxylase
MEAGMTGRERILTALSIAEPDRVPLFIHGINERPIMGIGQHLTDGLPIGKTIDQMTDAEKFKVIDTLFLILEEFGVDGYTCLPIGPGTEFTGGSPLLDDWGVGFARSPHGMPVPVRYPVRDQHDLERYTPPAPSRAQLILVDLMKARFQNTKAIFWMMRGAFVRSWRLAGMENLMLKMVDDPAFVHGLAALVTDYSLQQLDMLVESGLDVLIVEDDIADTHGPLISPKFFKEFVNPYNARLVEAAHRKGLKVVRHSDGNLWPLLDILLQTGYDGLNPLEPQAGMTMKKMKAYCGDRLCLLGNIDCQELLPSGTVEEVEAAVRQVIDDAAAGGGLIIDSSNTYHPSVNPENVMAVFTATHKHGVYPPGR